MKNNYGLFLLLLSLTVFCQRIKGQETEKLEQWIFPTKNNFLRLKSKTNSEDFFRINYFKISNQLVGTSLEIGLMNSEPSAKLFEIGNDEISLIRTKDGASIDSGGEEYSFGKDNVYFKLPTQNQKVQWNYDEGDSNIYHCQSYWKENATKGKFLVIERQASNNNRFSEKTVEYYSKNKGLVKQENINIKTGKISKSYAVEESGFDSQMDIQDFPLSDSLEPTKKDKSSETKEQSSISETKQKDLTDMERLNAEYLEKYGRSWGDYERLFKHLPKREIKKVKVYDFRIGRYKIVNVLWFPREEAINRQKYLDGKHRSTIFK
ncbi:hypothetical protein P2W68_18565 [Chryseobacterium arthrosphaerae]|uniref:hypothetical protein n=1 Tax=Chryseobacterium arthrosphaerae TaxID=651561 RepID=UPI0023E1D93F|nr:hypothetical protein [Chryseobacterium arthrosphaerae]WES96838.1 hypothetical protein P2W68_18565 [Chryseobacterium arthrosphaerae]